MNKKSFLSFLLCFSLAFALLKVSVYAESIIDNITVIGGNEINSSSSLISFSLTGKELNQGTVRIGVYEKESGTPRSDIEGTSLIGNRTDECCTVGLFFPQNDNKKNINYTVSFSTDTSSESIDIIQLSDGSTPDSDVINTEEEITTEKTTVTDENNTDGEIPEDTSIIYQLLQDKEEMESSGGELILTLMTSPHTENEKITVKNSDGTFPDFEVQGSGARRIIKIKVPENKDSDEKTLEYQINTTGSKEIFAKDYKARVIVKAPAAISMEVREFIVVTPNLPEGGSSTRLTVKGINLKASLLDLDIYEIVDGREVLACSIGGEEIFTGTENIMSSSLNMDGSTPGKTRIIVIKLKNNPEFNGKVTIGEEGNISGFLTELYPRTVYRENKSGNIVMIFDEPITLANKNSIHEKIAGEFNNRDSFTSLNADFSFYSEGNKFIISPSEA